MSWMRYAVCRDEDPELFHPLGDAGHRAPSAQKQEDDAKAVCRRCPVVTQCLEFALDHVPDGIAAGLNEAERREIRRAKPIRMRIDQPRTRCMSKRHVLEGDNLGVRETATGRVIRWCRACDLERRRTAVSA